MEFENVFLTGGIFLHSGANRVRELENVFFLIWVIFSDCGQFPSKCVSGILKKSFFNLGHFFTIGVIF